MAEQLFTFISQPGVRRDGTELDSPFYADGVWVRWQRGKPRKMGGYRATSLQANGPVRHVVVDSRNGQINAHYFSPWGIQRQAISATGAAGALDDRTPTVFAANNAYTWTHGFMYSALGSPYTALIACSTPDGDAIDSDTPGNIYIGDANKGDPMTVLQDGSGAVTTSGGIVVLQPFLFKYGSNGLIQNTKPNDLSTTAWDPAGGSMANAANVSGTKVVYGAPVRGGQASPAGLFWSLDSLIRVTFVGGTVKFNYDPLATPSSPLSKRAIVEFDGKFMWPAIDRFLIYTGVVQEVPNDMNQNWFFDNLNFAARNKVWGTKIQRFGEIWWFYPRGNSTECTDAIIYNYRENTWYDAKLMRSAGDKAGTFKYPVWCGPEDGLDTILIPTGTRGAITSQTNKGLDAPSQNAASSTATGGTGLAAGEEYWYKITATIAPTANAPTTATTGGSLAAGTYFYKITAILPSGETVASNEVSVTTTGTTSTNTVTWGATPGATGYRVYRGTASNGQNVYYAVGADTTFTDTGAAGTAGSPPASAVGETLASNEVSVVTAGGIVAPVNLGATTQNTGGTGLNSGTQYFYKVTATNAVGETTADSEVNVTTAAGISNPTATTISTANSGGTGLAATTQYFYKVTAVNALGETMGSNELNVTTGAGLSTPSLNAPSVTAGGSLLANTTYYYKLTAINGVGETLASAEVSATTSANVTAPTLNATSYTIDGNDPTGFIAGQTYYYKVTTVTASGESGGSNEQAVTVPNQIAAPTKRIEPFLDTGGNLPIGVQYDIYVYCQPFSGSFIETDATYMGRLTTTSTHRTVVVGWNLSSRDENGYVCVLRRTDGSATNYAGVGSGVNQIWVDASTFFDPHQWPLSPNNTAKGKVNLSWNAVTGATGYKLYRGTSPSNQTLVKTLDNVTSFGDRGDGTSSGSPPSAGRTIALSWAAVSGASSYRLYRGTASNGQNERIDTGNVTSFSDGGTATFSSATPPASNTTIAPTVTVNWNAVTGATGYRVYRGTTTNGQNAYYAVGAVTSFTDVGGSSTAGSPPGTNTSGGLSTNTITWGAVSGATGYRVYRGTSSNGQNVYYAVSGGGSTSFADVGGTSTAGSPPGTNTTASATSSNSLSWSAVTGATSYRVYRGLASGAQDVFYAVGNVTTYTDTGAASSAGSPPTKNTTSITLDFSGGIPAGVAVGHTVTAYADPFLAPNTTVTAVDATTVTLSDSPLADVPNGTLIAFSTQDKIIMTQGQTVTGASSGAKGTVVRSSYINLNLKDVSGTFTNGENLTLSDGRTAKVFAPTSAQKLAAVYQHEFGWDKVVEAQVTPILSSFTSQNYGLAVGAPFKPDQDLTTANVMTRVTRLEPDFNLVGGATLIIEGRSFAQEKNRELARYTITAGQKFQDMREQERILRFRFESNAVGGFYEQGQVLMAMEPGDERSGSDV